MCRFLAYRGVPRFVDALVCAPCHSLVHQSLHAAEAKTVTNGDGFGLGWYGERGEPGLYREVRPAWSDENLHSIARQVRSPLFFAHVRASTGTATTRANCHPFAHGRLLFMHNGQVGNWASVRRRVEGLIPDALYTARTGTTDSEAIFLAAVADGLEDDPVGALARTLCRVSRIMEEAGTTEPLRFTAAVADGASLHAVRWASDGKPPSLYLREEEDGLLLASEPVDDRREGWREVPKGCVVLAPNGGAPVVDCMGERLARAA